MEKFFRNSKKPQTMLKNLIFELRNTSSCLNTRFLYKKLSYLIRDLNYFEFTALDKAVINIFLFHRITKKDYFTVEDINCDEYNDNYNSILRSILTTKDALEYKKKQIIKMLNSISKTESGRDYLNNLEYNEDLLTILKFCEI